VGGGQDYQVSGLPGKDGYAPLSGYDVPSKAEKKEARKSKSQSYHLAINNNTPSGVRRKRRPNRIILKKEPPTFVLSG
jgi:hypothetical protein